MLRQMRELREQEREKRLLVEQQLAEERKRFDQLRDMTCQTILEMLREEIAELREERRRNAITQRTLVDVIIRLAEQRGSHPETRSSD